MVKVNSLRVLLRVKEEVLNRLSQDMKLIKCQIDVKCKEMESLRYSLESEYDAIDDCVDFQLIAGYTNAIYSKLESISSNIKLLREKMNHLLKSVENAYYDKKTVEKLLDKISKEKKAIAIKDERVALEKLFLTNIYSES